MWVNIHNELESIERINAKILRVTLVLLFLFLMIPYVTDLVSDDFNNKLAQGFCGVFVICVTLANTRLSMVLQNENEESKKYVEIMRKKKTAAVDRCWNKGYRPCFSLDSLSSDNDV